MLLVHPSRNITLWGKRRSLAELRGCRRTWSNARQKMLKSGGNKMDLGTLTRSKNGWVERWKIWLGRQWFSKSVLRKMLVRLPHLQAYLRVLDSLQANSVPHNGAPPTGGVGWPASSGPHTFAPQTGGLVYHHGSMPPTMLGANCYGSGTAQAPIFEDGQATCRLFGCNYSAFRTLAESGVTNRVQNVDPEI